MMRGKPSVWRRTLRLEAIHIEAANRAVIRAFAEAEGLDPQQAWDDMVAWFRECERLGLRTEQGRLAHMARTEGVPLEDLQAALAEIRAARP